jgi:alkylhydroperoxidase family enzyme
MNHHRCHARGCDTPVPPRKLFCLRHWRMTPAPLQREVWRHYRPGQEIDKQPSGAYLRAMLDAIAAVAAAEASE